MKLVWRKTVGLAVLCAVIGMAVSVSAQFGIPPAAVPPLVSFTGTLESAEEQEPAGFHSLRVTVHDKQWFFKLTNVSTFTGSDPGWMILEYITPPELTLIGPPERLRPLEKPEIAGKSISLEGRLYTVDRMLYVTAVHITPDADKPAER